MLSDKEKRAQYDQFGAAGFRQRYSQEDIFRGADFGDAFSGTGIDPNDIFSALFGGGHGGGGRGGFRVNYGGGAPGGAGGLRLRPDVRPGGGRRRAPRRRRGHRVRAAGLDRGGAPRRREAGDLPGAGRAARRSRCGSPPGSPRASACASRAAASRRTAAGRPGTSTSRCASRSTRSTSARGPTWSCAARCRSRSSRSAATLEVPTLDGVKKVKIAAGTQPQTRIRLAGHGMAGRGGKRGDFYLIVVPRVPVKLTREAEEAPRAARAKRNCRLSRPARLTTGARRIPILTRGFGWH